MVKDQEECFEKIFDGFNFVSRQFNEFLGFDFADSFLDPRNYRFNVFGLTLDFFKLGIQKSGSIVGEFPDLVPFDLNFFKVGFTLKEFLLEDSDSLFDGGLYVDVIFFLFEIGFEEGLG